VTHVVDVGPLQRLLQRRVALTPVIRATLRYGASTQALTVVSGSGTLDGRRDQRGTLNLNVQVHDAIPRELTPLGGAIDLSLGVRSIDGSEQVVPFLTDGVITNVNGLEVHRAVLSVQVTERSERVARWRFEQPFVVPSGTVLSDVVNLVLTNRGLPSNLPTAGPTIHVARVFGLDPEKNPWVELIELCQNFGWRLWMGRDGVPVLDQPPVPEDARDLLVLEPRLSLSSRPANVIVGRWTPTDGSAPVYALAEDTDPSSPTFVGGPYGRVTRYFASPLPISQAGANQAVQTILAKQRYQGAGRTWRLPFDPTIDPDDVVRAGNFTDLPTTVVEAVTVDLAGFTTVEVSEVPQ
jgi:hypothetical protein